MDNARQRLNTRLQQILPDAIVKPVALAQCPQITLYLIDANYSMDSLDTSVAVQVMDNPLYWLFCWASGQVMAKKILDNPLLVKDKVVLDVGAGSGVVAIAAAMAGAERVIASDIDELAHAAIALNAHVNNVDVTIVGDYREYQGPVDIITVADVLYDRENIPLLDALLRHGNELLLADSRVKNFSYPGLEKIETHPGETFPVLGGFDEFYEVNIYQRSV